MTIGLSREGDEFWANELGRAQESRSNFGISMYPQTPESSSFINDGLSSGARNLAVDDDESVYMADTDALFRLEKDASIPKKLLPNITALPGETSRDLPVLACIDGSTILSFSKAVINGSVSLIERVSLDKGVTWVDSDISAIVGIDNPNYLDIFATEECVWILSTDAFPSNELRFHRYKSSLGEKTVRVATQVPAASLYAGTINSVSPCLCSNGDILCVIPRSSYTSFEIIASNGASYSNTDKMSTGTAYYRPKIVVFSDPLNGITSVTYENVTRITNGLAVEDIAGSIDGVPDAGAQDYGFLGGWQDEESGLLTALVYNWNAFDGPAKIIQQNSLGSADWTTIREDITDGEGYSSGFKPVVTSDYTASETLFKNGSYYVTTQLYTIPDDNSQPCAIKIS